MAGLFLLLLLVVGGAMAQRREAITMDPLGNRITIPLGRAAFTCYATWDDLSAVQWKLNNTRVEDFDRNHVTVELVRTRAGNVGSLVLMEIPVEWNNTIVQCVGTFPSGNQLATHNSTLLLQGLLAAVGTLSITTQNNLTFTAAWSAPFTFEFASAGPDITYCVDVTNSYNSSSSSSSVLHQWKRLLYSQCGIVVTEFSYVLPYLPSTCDNLKLTVTPMNRAGNGTVKSIQLAIAEIIGVELPSAFNESDVITTSLDASEGHFFQFQANVSSMIFQCSAVISITPYVKLSFNTSSGLNCNQIDSNHAHLSLITSELPVNKHFTALFETGNCIGHVTYNVTLSTYDVQRVDIRECTTLGCFQFKPEFSINSEAEGFLLVMLPGDGDHRKMGHWRLRKGASNSTLKVFGLADGDYKVLTYDIEWDGTVSRFPATKNAIHSVSNTNASEAVHPTTSSLADIPSCRVSSQNTTIIVKCTYRNLAANNGFMCLLHDATNFEDLQAAQVTGMASELMFQSIATGDYIVTVLPHSQDYREMHTVTGTSAVHIQHINIRECNITMKDDSSAHTPETVSVPADTTTPTPIMVLVSSTSITSLILGMLFGLIMGCVCHRQLKCCKTRDRESLFRECRHIAPAENPVYEDIKTIYDDIGPGAVNKTHFELEENSAYGHMK